MNNMDICFHLSWVELLGHIINLRWRWFLNHQTAFQSGYTIFHSHQQRIRVAISPHACLLIGWSLLELLWWMWDSISLGFDLHFFIMTNDDEHLFMCLLVICIYSFMYIFNSKYYSILLRLWSTHLPILLFPRLCYMFSATPIKNYGGLFRRNVQTDTKFKEPETAKAIKGVLPS